MRVFAVIMHLLLITAGPAYGSDVCQMEDIQPLYEAEHVFDPGDHCPNVHSPTITILQNGDLLTAFWCATKEGSPDGRIVASRLKKESANWTPPETIADTPGRFDGNPVLFTFPDGRVWFLFSVRDPDAPGMVQIVTRESADDGYTWSAPREFLTPRGVRTRNRPIVMSSGEVLLPLHDHMSAESLFLVSPDQGGSWISGGRIVCSGGCIQPTVIQRGDGSLYALMRTWNEDPAMRFLMQSTSYDLGHTWSEGTYSNVSSVSSAVEAIRLTSGRVVLVYNEGKTRKRDRLDIALSEDGGRTWTWTRTLESGKGPYSYPSLVQAADGTIHLVYTYHRFTIRHVMLDEAWIMNGNREKSSNFQ